MILMEIDEEILKKMTGEELIRAAIPYKGNKCLEILRTGAILTERKKRPYHGDFRKTMLKEFGIKSRRGFLLMRAWKERDSYLGKIPLSKLNYKVIESILRIPKSRRADFIEIEQPERKTARENAQAVKEWRARLETSKKEVDVWE